MAFLRKHAKQTKLAIALCLFLGYWVFTGFALKINYNEGLVLLVIGVLVCFAMVWEKFKHILFEKLDNQCCQLSQRRRHIGGLILGACFFLGAFIFVLVDCFTTSPAKSENLLGLGSTS